ncbi:HIT family protein [Candidatus Pacearchaeota archaeon]|nr:HIT family protein [Candidatus Pacearchaeota archaeon]
MNKKEDCIFCKIALGEIPCDKVYEDDNFIVFNDIKPIAKGHCLVVPKKHYETLLDMPSTLGTEVIDLVKKQGLRLMKEQKAEGFNLVQNVFPAAGQIVMHVHFHVIPRKEGDGLRMFEKKDDK